VLFAQFGRCIQARNASDGRHGHNARFGGWITDATLYATSTVVIKGYAGAAVVDAGPPLLSLANRGGTRGIVVVVPRRGARMGGVVNELSSDPLRAG
jgi:hypothetical protein